MFDVDELVNLLVENVPYKEITISGGEPFLQPMALADLTSKLKKLGFRIVCYSGYAYEELIEEASAAHLVIGMSIIASLHNIDILVDGPYKKKYHVSGTGFEPGKWVGSTNQRIIDLSRTSHNNIVLWGETA